MKRWFVALVVMLMGSSPLHADGLTIGVGLGFFADAGTDLLVTYQPQQSHWQYGYRYLAWSETFTDPFTGNKLTKTDDVMTGPMVNYLFSPQEERSWYVGMSILRWSTTETSLVTGATSSDTTTDAYWGGGYAATVEQVFYYNVGLYLSPTAEQHTDTGVSSEDSTGGIDVLVQFGVVF